ncbi:MAG: shikimate dehydrogenase [Alphaproteobacteria bacterium]|nr:shikimate dehydrogenase [Alphaproteobacteria bacterium]
MTSETALLAGVTGAPIGHSLSPRLHGYWLKKYQINGYYIPVELASDQLEEGLRALATLGFRGVNVTLPFKEKALAIADKITDRAALIGAANTLSFRKNGNIQADNTDGHGFIANIRQNAPEWEPKVGPALVLGAGGASRAVISSLLAEGVPEIRLANRTRSRADMLCEHFGARLKAIDWNRASSEIAEAKTVVNTTSLGMEGQPALPISLDKIRKNTLVTDIVYTPLMTDFLQAAAAKGCVTVDGLGMLLHQAAPGFENWFRQKPTVDQGLRDAVLAP